MKKLILATALALAATAASALEIGVTGARDYSGAQDQNGYGLTLGQKFGRVGGEVGFQRFDRGTSATDYDRYSLMGSVDVAKFGPVTTAVKGGAAYLRPSVGQDGYAAVVGVGVAYQLKMNNVKPVTFGLDFTRQYGQDRVNRFDGNMVTGSVKMSF